MDVIRLIDTYYKTHEMTSKAELFLKNPSELPYLIEVATSELAHPYPESASWIMTHIAEKDASLLEPYQPVIIDRIMTSDNQSVLRNLVHVISELPLISYRESELLDHLLSMISDPQNKVALFVYALYKLIQFITPYPELINEINAILDQRSSGNLTPAMRIGIRNYHASILKLNAKPL